MTRRYFIETWDADLEKFTPHSGVPAGPYTLFGLREPIRALRNVGYPCDYSSSAWPCPGDPAVSIWSEESR